MTSTVSDITHLVTSSNIIFPGLPVVLSNAHFMHADPKLYERIEGIKPDERRHGSSFVIEPVSDVCFCSINI